MEIALITGSAGLIGSEAVRFFADKFDKIIGIDNDMRSYFFGKEASTTWNRRDIELNLKNYEHQELDIRNYEGLKTLFYNHKDQIKLIIHTAAQPSHDWAAKEPLTDFAINALGTANLLELARNYCPNTVFIFTSTNKVYGDNPNHLPLVEQDKRWEIKGDHPYYINGIDESMSLDHCKHSVFGASKVAADILCQEYGRYFGMNVGVFRGGCLTGPNHSGAQLHGFLSYLMKCTLTDTPYTIFGYKGKQVRDNIHSRDLINMFWHFYQNPRQGEAYNAGGGRHSSCSMIEAIELCENISDKKLDYSYSEGNRLGDHIWWISDVSKFKSHFPTWTWKYDVKMIVEEMHESMLKRFVYLNRGSK